ncbi:MAG: hypothetical protein IPN69_13430 [Acidobacteria bacterium]|nr:hypothetical protein [Acidobacteriota bacterium]MBK8148921.1 hypothetical protein [Acidobacteriota bacterium]MBK8811718.1 hypothetical protein [Acidobacteriota bacterium]
MQVLASEHYFFDAWREDNGECFLEVLCGTVAIYTIKIKLTPEEIAAFERDPSTLRSLADAVSYSPSSFLDRRV